MVWENLWNVKGIHNTLCTTHNKFKAKLQVNYNLTANQTEFFAS